MKADFSRISFDSAQHYSSVLHQQGRIITDADLNEQAAIHKHFLESLAASLTGNEGAIWLDPNGPEQSGRSLAPRPVELRHLPGFLIYRPGPSRESVQSLREMSRNSLREKGDQLSEEEKKALEEKLKGSEAAAGEVDKLSGAEWWISPGHYYAGGLRCENEAWVPVSAQPFLPAADCARHVPVMKDGGDVLLWILYLDAWERPLSWLDEPSLSDIALGAAVDTAQRAQVVWQVKSACVDLKRVYTGGDSTGKEPSWTAGGLSAAALKWPLPWNRRQPRLRVRIKPGTVSNDPCRPAFASAWQGQENLLYRVEIHDGTPRPSAPAEQEVPPEKYPGGNATAPQKDGAAATAGKIVTFKWSRENGSVAAKVAELKCNALVVFPGQLKAGGLKKGNRVELVKNDEELAGRPGPVFIVAKVQGDCVTFEADTAGRQITEYANVGDKLRRWDQKPCDGLVMAVEHRWVELEHGIEVLFEPAAETGGHSVDGEKHQAGSTCYDGTEFHTGDYWTFTARTATATVNWPLETVDAVKMEFGDSASLGEVDLIAAQMLPRVPVRADGKPPQPAKDAPPAALPPHGVRHRYALLAGAYQMRQSAWRLEDLRRILHLCDEPSPRKPADKPQTVEVPEGLTASTPPARTPIDVLKDIAVAEEPKTKAMREVKEAMKEADKARSEEAAKLLTEKLAASFLLKAQPGTPAEKAGGTAAPARDGTAAKKSSAKKGKST